MRARAGFIEPLGWVGSSGARRLYTEYMTDEDEKEYMAASIMYLVGLILFTWGAYLVGGSIGVGVAFILTGVYICVCMDLWEWRKRKEIRDREQRV